MTRSSTRGPITIRRGVWILLRASAFVFYVGIAAASAGCDGEGSSPEATYVGGGACVSCHAAETAAWEGSHHDLAMAAATEETVLGDFDDASFTHLGTTTSFYRDGERFLVRTEGPDGDLAEYPVAYAFGVTPLQQYLLPFPGGRYQVLSIAWDARPATEGGQRWFHLYPDEVIGPDDPLHWTRVSQNWNYMCAECHSTALDKGYDVENRTYETTWSDIDVSCEACHGPASRHVELAESLAGAEAVDGWQLTSPLTHTAGTWRVEPGATTATHVGPLPGRAEIDTCAHCHSRRSTVVEGHVPGEPLLDSDAVSLLREGLYHPDGQILDEVYVYGSFLQSKMYGAGVTCSDCHDPHTLEVRAPGNALCAQCHVPATYDTPDHHFHPADVAGSQCVECHMPASTYMVVDPRRDHSLRIPRPDLTQKIGVPNACNSCHTDQTVEWAVAAVEEQYGPTERLGTHYGEAIHAGRLGSPGAVSMLTALASDTSQPAIARATALTLLMGRANQSAVGALQAGLGAPEPLLRMGALAALEALPPQTLLSVAEPLLSDPVRSVRLEAARLLAAVPRASLSPEQAARIDQGVAEYERSQLVNADHPSALANLGNLYGSRGQLDASETLYRSAIEVDATFLPATLNLADLHRVRGRDDLAEQVLTDALQSYPDSPELSHAMGLLLVRRGDAAGAMEWLRRATEAQPENPRFAYVYGVALASAGSMDSGLRVLETAVGRHPYNRDILSALTAYNRDRGDREAAIGYAERLVELAPDDPQGQQLLASLRSGPP